MSNIYPVEEKIVFSCQLLLLPLGWEKADGIAIATKEYKTAVGIKVAMIYLLPASDNQYRLSGEYQSQGRNILETSTVFISKDWNHDLLEKEVKEFAKDIDDRVANSYAYRLMHMEETASDENQSNQTA